MARAAVSVPANIAEGYGRGSLGDYLRFLDIAKGSLAELEYYIHFIEKESLLPPSDAENLRLQREKTGRLLHGLWQSLKRQAPQSWDHGQAIAEPAALMAVAD
jgi:four helix bundle protein